MAQSTTPMLLSKKSQEGIIQFHKECHYMQGQNWNLREQMRKVDLAYIREKDMTSEHNRAKIANYLGDSTRFQNITVPIVMPMVESAVTYQSAVFLQGVPIFGVVSNPQHMDQALQMETVIDNQAIRGGWVREIMLALRDGFKYNLAAMEICWERSVSPAFETDLGFSTTQARPKEIIWEGNVLKRRDPYNLIFDTRVAPTDIYMKGEFAGYTELMSRIQLKAFINSLPDKMVDNVVAAFESGLGTSGVDSSSTPYGYYTPELNPGALLQDAGKYTTNWMSWVGASGADSKIQYKDMYEVTTLYARILPSDFNIRVPAQNTPQVWKFIIVNHSVILYAERQTNAHGYIPMLFMQPNEDGLTYQTKSLASNVMPIQDITSAMWNSVIAARRRAISDRGIYDPSRIAEHHINSDNPAAKIPVRPSAYGKNIAESYYPIPFRDDQSGILMQETQQVVQMANMITGQNPARQGQFVKGNKTLHEFSTVMSNANGRDQLVAMLLEAQLFTPLKEMIKVNILQYQGGVSLFNREQQKEIEVDPVEMRKAVMEFKISDGLMPSDKLINGDTLQTALQVIGSSPQIAEGYNIGPLFSYFIKTQGGRISEFEKSPEQVAYEQAMAQWQQTILQAIQAGATPEQLQAIPQPLPEQYNYVPGNERASPAVQPKVNNITNNITNTEQR